MLIACVENLDILLGYQNLDIRLILFFFQSDSKCTQCCCGKVIVSNTQTSGDKWCHCEPFFFFSCFSLNLLSPAVTVLTKARWNMLSYSLISKAAWLENLPQKAIAGNHCSAYYKLLWFMMYVFGISISFRNLHKPRKIKNRTHCQWV